MILDHGLKVRRIGARGAPPPKGHRDSSRDLVGPTSDPGGPSEGYLFLAASSAIPRPRLGVVPGCPTGPSRRDPLASSNGRATCAQRRITLCVEATTWIS
jgi:hypothetical protein